ncbi:MAG: efflux RND transporter periplasmic adaptor subunit [Kamptonema sp. SIO4C4]|nr:efflux RND transporter periplasmic adaptor subunit [Kamptonema sp. SIO4C4]
MMHAVAKQVWGAALGVSVLVTGCGGSPPQQRGQGNVPVSLQEVETSIVAESSEFVGTLEAAQRVILRPEIEGRVVNIFAENGANVEAGTPIIQLRPDQQLAQVNSAVAQVNVRRAGLQSAAAEVRAARSQLATAQAQRDRARADLEQQRADVNLQQEEYKRTSFLVEQGAQPRQQLDIQTRNRDAALAARNSAQEALKAAEASIAEARERVRAAEANLAREQASITEAEANVQEVSEDLRFTRVTSPIRGVIGDIAVNVGDYVNTGEALTTIIQNDALELRLEVPVERSDQLRLGLPVEIVGNENQVVARGRISFISPNVEANAQSILVKATFRNNGQVRDGQFVRARVIWERDRGILVPTVAISRVAGQEFVFVAEEDTSGEEPQTIARQTPVQLGDIQGNSYQVIEGIEEGDRIITSNILKLRDGVPIQPQENQQNAQQQDSFTTP